ncbi:universal stress protein [Streptomyces chartreusis]|uniref:universal stress protein n=1 Tax=Streptomyces chartreusis TaxID=1969 RepID=UPI00340C44EA
MARLAGASVHVLHVVRATATLDTVVRLEDAAEATAILDEAVAALRDEGIKADGTHINGVLNDVPALINETVGQFGADLIVLGPHHRGVVAASSFHASATSSRTRPHGRPPRSGRPRGGRQLNQAEAHTSSGTRAAQ